MKKNHHTKAKWPLLVNQNDDPYIIAHFKECVHGNTTF